MAPLALLQQLREYYWGKAEEPRPPPLSTGTVAVLSTVYTLLYVLPFYLFAATRPSPAISRDSVAVIRARVRLVVATCALCTLATVYVLVERAHLPRADVLRLLGLWPASLVPSTLRPLLLTAVLFAGPLFERVVVEARWRDYVTGGPLVETLWSWTGYRNYVVGPLTEELLFRSLLVSLSLSTPLSPARSVLLTPLYFGIAHVHHLCEFRLTHPRVSFVPALLRSLFQFAYTTLFGWYAAFVFVRTGSLPAVVLAHAFCNWMGLPRLWGRLEGREGEDDGAVPMPVAMAPPKDEPAGRAAARTRAASYVRTREGEKRRARAAAAARSRPADGRPAPVWTVAYYLLLVAGALGFWKGLWPLTACTGALAEV